VEELAGCHEQKIAGLEEELENKMVYIESVEIALAELSSRVDAMEGKLCRCHEMQVKVEDDPSSELFYEEEYFTLTIRIAGMIEDVPRLIPIGEVKITPGGFDDVRDGDVEPDSVASQVAEQVLHTGDGGPNTHWVHGENIEIAVNM